MKKLIMMVGLPRSGKTTRAVAEKHPIVCPDAIRLALHGQPYVSTAEPHVWAIAKTMVRALFLAGHDTVIFDACNNTRKRRDEWRSEAWQREFYVIEAQPDTCEDRAVVDGRDDLIPVIRRMAEQHEPVSQEELDEG